jgi:heat shock protein HtpX
MAQAGERPIPWRARVPPALLLLVATGLVAGWLRAWAADQGAVRTAPWWVYLFLVLMSVAMAALAGAVTIDPRPLALRRALAGTALAWTVLLAGVVGVVGFADEADRPIAILFIAVLGAVTVALAGIGLTTDVSSLGGEPDWIARFGAIVIFAAAIVLASGVVVGVVGIARAAWRSIGGGVGLERLPWILVAVVIVLPVVTFGLASILTRQAAGGSFWAQAAANRRNSLLLVITLVGIVAAMAEIIAASLTFRAMPALGAAVVAAGLGLLIALVGNRFGSRIILETAGARAADPKQDEVLINVVRELTLAANIPMPAVYVIADGSQNAFATGRDPQHAALAVTSGLVQRMDREQLQGVIGHELGHIRNLDTRYALFVAVLVGLVALVTDGFLRLVIEGWKQGAFFWKGDDKSALATLAAGILVGLFLLIVAALLRIVAPFFSALVQASTSREREFLADAASVEFTRNPRALERALASIANDRDTLEAANRGTQHLWFRNPVKDGSDRRAGLLSTHPSLGARIDRLRALQGLAPLGSRDAVGPAAET